MTIFLRVVNNSFLVYNKRRVCIIIIIITIIRSERPLNADITRIYAYCAPTAYWPRRTLFFNF